MAKTLWEQFHNLWSRYLFLFCMSWDSLQIYCLCIISTISNLSWVCLSFWQTFCCIASCMYNSYCNSSYYILDITDLEHIRLLCLYNAKIFIELKCQNTFWDDCTVYRITVLIKPTLDLLLFAVVVSQGWSWGTSWTFSWMPHPGFPIDDY